MPRVAQVDGQATTVWTETDRLLSELAVALRDVRRSVKAMADAQSYMLKAAHGLIAQDACTRATVKLMALVAGYQAEQAEHA